MEKILTVSRRQFLALAGVSTATLVGSPLQALYTCAQAGQSSEGQGYGPLIADPGGLLDLPRGFQYRVFSRTGDPMSDGYPVPGAHDGMAAFAGPDDTTILVRNHELSPDGSIAAVSPHYDPRCLGGTTTLIVDHNRQLVRHYTSLAGTYRNCAGGPTPWNSWISCEENTSTPASDPAVTQRHGYVFEVPAAASGPVTPVPLTAMGRFNHEAVAVDPLTGIVYLTEDRLDGLFYRFIPQQPGQLQQGGILDALKIKGKAQAVTQSGFAIGQTLPVEWVRIDEPDPAEDTVRIEGFAKGAAQFSRGEGIWFGDGRGPTGGHRDLYFCCTNGGQAALGQIWRYEPGASGAEGGTLSLFVEPNDSGVLDYPDNITVSPFGDLYVCEDGWNQQYIRGITREGQLYPFARNALNTSEFTGVCFGTHPLTLFLNIQTPGITFAIWGPFV